MGEMKSKNDDVQAIIFFVFIVGTTRFLYQYVDAHSDFSKTITFVLSLGGAFIICGIVVGILYGLYVLLAKLFG